MMAFFPIEKETRLVTLTKKQLLEKFTSYVKPLKGEEIKDESKDYLFNGLWNSNGFSLSLKLKISNNFVPIINGSYLSSDEGLLLNLTYELFPATKKLLLFWTIITLLITLFFIGIYQQWLYGAISFGFCLVNYILSRENFKIQLKKSKRMLNKMLS